MSKRWLTIKQVIAREGMSVEFWRTLCDKGLVRCRCLSTGKRGVWTINAESLAEYLRPRTFGPAVERRTTGSRSGRVAAGQHTR